MFFACGPRKAQEATKTPQVASRDLPGGRLGPSRGLKTALRRLKTGLRRPQGSPETAEELPGRPQTGPRAAQDGTDSSRRAQASTCNPMGRPRKANASQHKPTRQCLPARANQPKPRMPSVLRHYFNIIHFTSVTVLSSNSLCQTPLVCVKKFSSLMLRSHSRTGW